jgi:ketosteroid isomerase-like protein
MTIQEVINYEKAINQMMMENKMMEAFETYYGDDVVMIQNDGYTTTGKDECRKMEQGWMENLKEFRGTKLLQSVVHPFNHGDEYQFLVVATWWSDFTIMKDGKEITEKGNQTSYTFWKDGKIRKVEFVFPSEVIA